MKKQIIFSLVLVLVGGLLGFFVMVNWQLHQAIKQTSVSLTKDSQELDKIEKYLTDKFPPVTNTDKTK